MITFWYICCISYNHLLRPSAAHCMITVAFWYICWILYNYLLIHLLNIVQLPSDTSAVYCTITFWYICCILYNYLLIHLLYIVQLPSDTSAVYCTVTFWYIYCILYDYGCLRYHLLHTLRYILIPSPLHNTISWYHLLHTVLSYYGWCSRAVFLSPVNSFFVRRDKFTGKYLSNFFKFIH
jgi:hypothetical protein